MGRRIKQKGIINLPPIEYDEFLERKVFGSNNNSGRINLPIDFIGESVLVFKKKKVKI